jgi:hypothetical protein
MSFSIRLVCSHACTEGRSKIVGKASPSGAMIDVHSDKLLGAAVCRSAVESSSDVRPSPPETINSSKSDLLISREAENEHEQQTAPWRHVTTSLE